MTILPADGRYAVKFGMRDQQKCTFLQKADSCLLGLWVECRVENVPYKKSPICRRTLPSSGIIGPPLI